jgi:hypothetical protein
MTNLANLWVTLSVKLWVKSQPPPAAVTWVKPLPFSSPPRRHSAQSALSRPQRLAAARMARAT